MMIKKTITIILIVFCFYASEAQYTFEHIYKDPKHQIPGNVIETSNGDFIFSIASLYPNHDSKIIKIDNEGNILDNIVISNINNILYTLFKFDENSFFISGEWNIDDKYYFWIRKYDYNFNLLNEFSFPVSGRSNLLYNPIITNNKNNLVISICCEYTQTNDEIHIFEINPNCEIIKHKKYLCVANFSYPTDIIQKDSIYFLFSVPQISKSPCVVYKLDSTFNILKHEDISPLVIQDLNNAKWINDSMILLSGRFHEYSRYNFWETKVLKLKVDTCINWHYPLKDTSFAKNDSNNFIGLKNNLDFIDVNNVFLGSYYTIDDYGYWISNNYSKIVLYKLDSALNLKWEKNYGGDACYTLICVKATQDGGCIMSGTRYDYLTQSNETDPFIIKVDSAGDVAWVHNLPSSFMKINVYPNPGSDKLIVNNPPLNTSLVLYNTQGQTVITQSLNQSNSINTSSLQCGVYFYRLIDDKGKVLVTGKWVKAGE